MVVVATVRIGLNDEGACHAWQWTSPSWTLALAVVAGHALHVCKLEERMRGGRCMHKHWTDLRLIQAKCTTKLLDNNIYSVK